MTKVERTEKRRESYDSMYELMLDIWEMPTEFTADSVTVAISDSITSETITDRYIPLCEALAFLNDCEEFIDKNFCYGHRKKSHLKKHTISIRNHYTNIKADFSDFYDAATLRVDLSHHDFFDTQSYLYHVKIPRHEKDLDTIDNMMMDMAIEVLTKYLIEMSIKHISKSIKRG